MAKRKNVEVGTLMHGLLQAREFKETREAIFAVRDKQIFDHLRNKVYTPEHFALLRLVIMISKRECQMIAQSLKHVHLADGKRQRQKLAPDSKQYAPPIFALEDIMAEEAKSLEKTQVTLHEHGDRRGADVSGAPYSLDRHLQNLRDAASGPNSRSGGFASAGTDADPDILCCSGDGAATSAKFSGVRVGFFWGSTEFLSQSSLDFADVLVYLEESHAEDYLVLKARLAPLLPQLRRLYRTRHLRPGGVTSERYTDIVLTADKPFIRHVCGKNSHNADCFGAPACRCRDADLFNFTFDKKTHYCTKRGEAYERCCHLSHTPVWEALGEDEPETWSMTCDVCNKTWTQDGGYAELEAERVRMARDPAKEKHHIDTHDSQGFNRPPLIPFHFDVFDPMHGIHCEVNALLDEAVHKPLELGYESKEPGVKETCARVQNKVNDLWKKANLPKLIQFGKGKDSKGKDSAHSHALNGPTFKKAWGKQDLLLGTFEAMREVYALRECVPDVSASQGPPSSSAPKKKKTDRTASFDAPEPSKPITQQKAASNLGLSRNGGARGGAKAPGAAAFAFTEPPPPPPKVPYEQRVGCAVIALIYFYEYITAHHGEKASIIRADPAALDTRASKAVVLAVQLQRAMIAVCGTHRRRAYAHDMVYGLHRIYSLVAKPWAVATEGSEHKHQEVKRFFAHLICHNDKGPHGGAFEILRMELVKEQLFREHGHLLPRSNYIAQRINRVQGELAEAKEGKKRQGPCGFKMYTKESGMMQVAGQLQAAEFMRGSPACVP